MPEHTGRGQITGADGRAYSRRGTRATPSVADELIGSGAGLVLDMYSTGQFEWFSENEARVRWADVRPHVISGRPTTKQLGKHEMWNAGVWQADDGTTLVYLTGHC
ncbi:hypothetical protein [Nocardioides plantarum]|uniref:hypothetical protein n=1 Tax=Nocardioides plantarum TaxID=29299 RepID=UPI00360BBEE1